MHSSSAFSSTRLNWSRPRPDEIPPADHERQGPMPGGRRRSLLRTDRASMYPNGFQTVVSVPATCSTMGGQVRPHHFAGVATVVTKLFGLIRPHRPGSGKRISSRRPSCNSWYKDFNLGVVSSCVRRCGSRTAWRKVRATSISRRKSGATATILHASFRPERRPFAMVMRDGKRFEARMIAIDRSTGAGCQR